MKNSTFKIILFALCWCCQALCYGQTPVAQNGQLRVIGTKLCNQYGAPIQLRGMSSHGIQWYGACLPDAALDALAHDWGADIFRVAMYVQEGGYETDPAGFTAKVKALVDKATARGMYALIDFHMLTPGDPNYNLDRARTFFTEMANTYKNQNNIIYEIANEPNGSAVNWATIKRYADQIIPVIRNIDSDAVIIVGTPGWSSLGLSNGSNSAEIANNPLTFGNVLYTFHFYAASHRDSYLNELSSFADRYPVFVTEFGTQDASGDGANDLTMAQRYIDLMRTKKISWAGWNYSDDFRSGAVWKTGTCPNGPWTTNQLKEAGLWVRNNMLSPADDFPGSNNDTGNIARGKTCTASSQETAEFIAANATDGNTSTRWASTLYVDPQWIYVDLGAAYDINRVKIAWEAAYGKDYLIQTSSDALTWTTVKTVTGNTTVTNDHTGLAARARYVRIYGTTRGTEWGYSIYELEVYGTPVSTTTNVALNKAVTVSSVEEPGLEGNYATDGNAATRWSATMYVDPQWMYVDLGATYNINRVKIVWEAAYGKDFLIQTSANAATWTTVRNITGNTALTNDYTGLSASGRYVRIYGTARGSAYGYSIYELEVYGTAAAATAAVTEHEKIAIYPIPAEDYITIDVTGATGNTTVLLTGADGTVHRSETMSGSTHKLDVRALPTGVYFVQILNGGKRSVKRIWKNKK